MSISFPKMQRLIVTTTIGDKKVNNNIILFL
ncbi:hypothetical protein EO220_0026 [Saccharomyces cerevisiae PE-2]|nr:hypothetical protein EO220_0026 [Saccharomyces cerevisiae PE-2]CAF1540506.1 hypothetical protein C2U11_0026 [Saccharomyces cerevisiae PE-2]